MLGATINDKEFELVRRFFVTASGIRLNDSKRSLVCGRLGSRLRKLELPNYQAYLEYIQQPAHALERQLAVDLLTTNETYFFREAKHFDFLARWAAAASPKKPLRVWSAACSSGEEPYSIAMVLAEALPCSQWQIVASDLSHRMLETAKQGMYPCIRLRELPERLLKKYCLKGIDDYDGWAQVQQEMRQQVEFHQLNLTQSLPEIGQFDMVFLRNMLIYFDPPMKRQILSNVMTKLKPGGFLLVGHSESLQGVTEQVKAVQPAVYQKVTSS